MKNTFGAIATLALVCVAGCTQKTPPPKPLPTPPSITSFAVDRTRINPGESVTLSYVTSDADSVTLLTQTGDKVALTGDVNSGSATVTPAATTLYVLKVSGPGGRASAFAQVAVGEDLKDAFLVSVPPVIDSGDTAQLVWSAFHAASASITTSLGETIDLDVSKGSGVIDVTPARTTTYHLVAHGANADTLADQSADVKVRPVVADFTVAPAAAKAGEKLTLSWTTRGANEVVLTEKTFGELAHPALPAAEGEVDHGTFEWTVPDTLPSGAKILDGQPLEFTLTVKQTEPAVTVTRTVTSFVGDGPHIAVFDVPVAVTENHSFDLKWKTQNAERVQIFADNGLVYEPLTRDTAQISNGKITLKAPKKDAVYRLVAFGHAGTQVQDQKTVRVVKLPAITDFNVPATVNAPGDAAAATWKTTDATRVVVRIEDGPAVYTTSDTAKVASGGTDLYPGARVTFVLDAFNDAGDSATAKKTVDVSAPGVVTASPAPITTGETVTVNWAVDPGITADLVGDPTVVPIKTNPSIDWYELENNTLARPLAFNDPNDAVAEIPAPFAFRFPFVGEVETTFFASTNGFVSFANVGAQPENIALDDSGQTKNAPKMVAPFWDDLNLGASGSVLYMFDDTAFPRRLVVQWDKVHTAADPDNTELTFQVQLLETGQVIMIWKSMTGTDTAGENASIGWRLNASQSKEVASSGAAVVTADDELTFFSGAPAQGQFTVIPDRTSEFVFFAKLATTNAYVVYPAHVNVIKPKSVLINEAMIIPDSSATAGKWVELYNTTKDPIDLSGVKLTSDATMTEFVFPEGTVVPPNQYLVVGDSTDALQNGGAPVTVAWSTITPSDTADDTLTLSAVQPIDAFAYTASSLQAGVSVQPPEDVLTDGTPFSCTRTTTFGTNGAIGTPGAQNETCFDYTLTTIPVDYEDISATGTALFSSYEDDHDADVDVSTNPITYFKTQVPKVTACSNGWLSLSPTTATAFSNKTTPSTSTPTATAAPFWDDLSTQGTSDANVFAQYIGAAPGTVGRWIFQWHHSTHLSQNDDLNFEAKFFDDGRIEYHYQVMSSGSSYNYADGNSATIWIERPAGDAALPVGVNQAVIQPNTAYRFTPKP